MSDQSEKTRRGFFRKMAVAMGAYITGMAVVRTAHASGECTQATATPNQGCIRYMGPCFLNGAYFSTFEVFPLAEAHQTEEGECCGQNEGEGDRLGGYVDYGENPPTNCA